MAARQAMRYCFLTGGEARHHHQQTMITTTFRPSKDSEILQELIDGLIARGPAVGKETVTPVVIARWERKIKKLKAAHRKALKIEAAA
jgi:hypothetical protein